MALRRALNVHIVISFAILLGGLLATTVARADGRAGDDAARARREFNAATELVREAKWAEAIEAFERASAISPHAVTSYNLGACERAMGHFTRARTHLLAALARHEASGRTELARELVTETNAFLGELDRLLVRVTLSFAPEGTALTIDGRPLEVLERDATPPLLGAGLRPAGTGEPPPATTIDVLLDPGAHVFVLTRSGFADAVQNRSFLPGSRSTLDVALERLPAALHVDSNRPRALVAIDGVDVGVVPVDVARAPGVYRVTVREPGFLTYETRLALKPGDDTRLRATLAAESPSVFTRWWFWTAAGVVVAGAATATYVLTRPEPRRADVGGGTLGWSVAVR